MANLKNKDMNDLGSWNMKELRKLRITLNNRIQSLQSNSKRELPSGHILHAMGEKELEQLLIEVKRAEKKLANE